MTGSGNILPTAFGRTYFGKLTAAQANISNGNTTTGIVQGALGVNQLPFSCKNLGETASLAKDGVLALKTAKDSGALNEIPSGSSIISSLKSAPINPKVFDATKIKTLDQFHFFFEDTILGKAIKTPALKGIAPMAHALDKTALDVVGKPIIEKLGGAIVKDASGAITGIAVKEGIKTGVAAQFAGNVLGKIPLIGLAISSLLELPSIKKGFDNNDGWEQVGRSAMNVTGNTTGAAIGAAIGAAFLPPIGLLVGGALGGWAGNTIAGFIGDHTIGKSKEQNSDKGKQNISPSEQELFAQQQQMMNERSQAPLRA